MPLGMSQRALYPKNTLYLTKRALLIAKRAPYVIPKSPVCLYVMISTL